MENILEIKEGCLSGATSYEVAELAVKILDSKLASEIKLLKIDAKTVIADYFVICSGTSTTQVKGLADEVAFQLKQQGREPARTEGYESGSWILLDYLDVVVQVFLQSEREFYSLDKLWQA